MADNPFEFEMLLDDLDSVLTTQQKTELKQWRAHDLACDSDGERFNLNNDKENALRLNTSVTKLLEEESEIRNTLANVYGEVPNPEKAVNLFDRGVEKARRTKLRSDVIKLQSFVTQEYTRFKQYEKNASDFLLELPSNTHESEELNSSASQSNESSDSPLSQNTHSNENLSTENRETEKNIPVHQAQNPSMNVWEIQDELANSMPYIHFNDAAFVNTENWVSTLA